MELTGNVSGLINLGGGGGGSTVEVTPILTSGEHIADIEVDGVTSELYAPEPTEPTEVEVTPIVTSGEHIADIEVNGVTSELYAPTRTEVNYSTTPQRTGRKWIDGTSEVKELVIQGTASQLESVIDLSAYNINNLISITGNVKTSDESAAIIFPYSTTDYCVCAFGYNNHVLYFSRSNGLSTYNKYTLILTYT